jgi:phosphomannomutase
MTGRVDVPKPAPSAVAAPIRFGTSGWRGVLGEEVTYPRLRVLVRAVCDWVAEGNRGERVLIGWDGRFASRALAETAARIVVDAGLRPTLASDRTPTPAVTHALYRGRCAAGLVLTASHNPAAYHGLKVFGPTGATIPDADARRIEAIAASRRADEGPPLSARLGRREDLTERYRRALAELFDGGALRSSRLSVFYDAMHGCGGGVLDRVLAEAGARIEGLRLEGDPHFGGQPPDPTADRLDELARKTRLGRGLRLGLATDGDGDRIAAVDGRGSVLTETQVLAVLVDHLAATGQVERGLALTAGTGSLVEKVARAHGLFVERHPVGFKHLSAALETGRVDVAGEESGGFALAGLGSDKDGILAGCLLARLVATTGEPLEAHVARLEGRFGPSACGRAALPATASLEAAVVSLSAAPPVRIGRCRVVEVEDRFGLRLSMADDGFVLLRRSGTEPVLRIYAEAPDRKALDERLVRTKRLLQRRAPKG